MFEMCCSNKQSTEVATRDNSSGLQKKSILKKEKKKKKVKNIHTRVRFLDWCLNTINSFCLTRTFGATPCDLSLPFKTEK